MKFCAGLVAFAAALLLNAPLAMAQPSDDAPGAGGHARSDHIELRGALTQRRTEVLGTALNTARRSGPAPTSVTTLVPTCGGNSAEADSPDALCPAATATCPEPDEIRYWVFSARLSPSGDVVPPWTDTGTEVCRGGPLEEALALVSPELTLEDFQSLPLAPGQANIEPGDGNVLIRVPTNVYVRAGTQDLTTTLLGQPVQVRATPVRYSWDFGDGSDPVVTTDAGDPYPELRVTYAYPERGQHTITLTTFYTGEFSVAGGPWLPVAGEAQVLSESVPVRVLAGNNSLVADTLP